MNTLQDIVSVVFLAALVANLVHWNGRKTERWIYIPPRGWFSTTLALCGCAAGIGVLLWIARVIPLHVGGFFGLFYMATTQVYSVWFRHRQRQVRV
jgi:hypothetical protein